MDTASTAPPATARVPVEGDLVVDTITGRLAKVMEVRSTRYVLRPPAGGREWERPHDKVRPAAASEEVAETMRARGLLSSKKEAAQ
jgi:hypothetical protein